MIKKSVYLIILFIIVFWLSGIAISNAKTQCLVARRTNPANTLWVSKCEDGACGSFSQISGMFTSQPTVVFDQDTQYYYLYGTGLKGAIFRRTLNMLCQPISGWVKMTEDNFSASPIGAAAGNLYLIFNSVNGRLTELTSTVKNILTLKVVVPDDGFILCRASGTIRYSNINTTEQVSGIISLSVIPQVLNSHLVSSGFIGLSFNDGGIAFPFAIENWFTENGRIDRNYYLTGKEAGLGANTIVTNVDGVNMTCQFHPYSF